MKTGVRLAAIVLIGVCATGCASNTPDARDLRDQLVAVGVSPAAATCVVHEMRKTFTDRRLGAVEKPTRAELALQRAIVRKCEVKVTKQ